MSTKIYDGISIKNMNLIKLNDWCLSVRKKLKEVATAQYYNGVIKIAVSIFLWQKTDMNLCPYYHGLDVQELLKRKDNPKEWNAREVYLYADKIARDLAKRSAIAKTIMDNEPDFDYTTSISIFPMEDKILAIPFTTNGALKECIFLDEMVSRYGYWNNTDGPSDLTEEQWEQRKKDWDEVFKTSGIPANCGMSIVLLDNDSLDWYLCPDKPIIEKYILSCLKDELEYCKMVAKQKLMDTMWEEAKTKQDITGHETSTILEIHHYLKDHPELIDEEAQKYIGQLDFKTFFLEGFEYTCTP